ncbi:MAG: oligopeptide/dipeptide ABC transporter ATP-binding protein [Planctomycetaceae bacterium]
MSEAIREPLLEVRNLRVRFPIWGGVLRHKIAEVRAVDGVSFTLYKGETLGLVGESGCGKTTIAKAICNILKETSPGVHTEGSIIFHSAKGPVDLLTLGRRQMKPYRQEIQMIFQDPFSSLNPRMTVGEIIERPLKMHTRQTAKQRRQRVHSLLGRVGMQPDAALRYPHEFSGGQRQRIGIARALAVHPRLVIADEPVSALDVSVQSQVINLLQDVQDEFGLTYLFVAHDLSVVHHISNRIAVMYLGDMAEVGDASVVYHQPMHPYSRALLSAVPQPDPRGKRARRTELKGEIPSPLKKPSGCSFHPRCPIARPDCSVNVPPLEPKEPGQLAACPYT